jgi:chlorophyll/bacteriochlorophyll a synthase
MVVPAPSAVVELLKPITWFAPIWAFACGAVSSAAFPGGLLEDGRWLALLGGLALAGPLVCGTSQAVNDWFDRHVDAINEPHRPVPSGRVPGRWGLYIGVLWTCLSLLVAALLGPWVLAAAAVGLSLAWMYSAPPLRLKRNGWWGNSAVALCYEGLPWITGALVVAAVLPSWHVAAVAMLYSLGAHGIMTLNDFKSVDGDSRMGVRSLPVQLGADRAAKLACGVMAAPQIVVIALLWSWGMPVYAAIIGALLLIQFRLMGPLLADPRGKAPWYNATGTTLYVLGMLVAALALRSLPGAGS